ncbi:MAG: ABC transporter substrate-binding protein, partial [Thalassospira sp.]|nr:ABC transporter substrate-binding protein [Thalassospira sp.]
MINHDKRVLAVGVFAAGLISSVSFASATEYPLSIENCGTV